MRNQWSRLRNHERPETNVYGEISQFQNTSVQHGQTEESREKNAIQQALEEATQIV